MEAGRDAVKGMSLDPEWRALLPEVSNARQNIVARSSLVTGSPAYEVRTRAEQHEDALVTSWCWTEAALGSKPAR